MGDVIRDTGHRVSVDALRGALDAHPEFWNENTARTASAESPHREVDDIFLRFAREGADVTKDFESVWFDPAAATLGAKEIVYDLARSLRADRIGSVLVTRIPPGKSVKPHIDHGWHAGFYRKFGVQIASAPRQAFCFDGVRFESAPGDIYEFRNDVPHWVVNDSREERITMIVCLRLEQAIDRRA